MTDAERSSARRYSVEFLLSMGAYSVLMVGVALLVKQFPGLRLPLALVPMIPLVIALRAALAFFERMDELGRRVQLEAVSFAFLAGVMLTMTYGLLEAVAKLPRISWTFVAPIFILLYGLGTARASRKYR